MSNSVKPNGYSLPEMVVALAITTVAVTAATSGWMFFVRGERMNSAQAELDIDVRKSMENLKHDLRLSSLSQIYYYPAGPGPYEAISFPMASDTNNDGLAESGPGGTNVLWTHTVIYHVWRGSPNELRKTTLYPRDNSLTPAQFQEQLNSVVTYGDASHTYGAANSSTRAIFRNLFTWRVWGNGATYDGYSASEERDAGVNFGSAYLGSGTHQLKFSVVGKNAASSSYKIGVDSLVATASGADREGEAQLPVAAQSGATAAYEYMPKGSWSGNYQLGFPAASTGAYFTLNVANDRWEETNFRGPGAICTRTVVGFDTSLNPKDYILQLEGSPGYPWGAPSDPYAWYAFDQTASNSVAMTDNSLTGCVVRVLLRGSAQAVNNRAIRFSGSYPYVYFMAGASPLHIQAAYIAEAASSSNATCNAAGPGTPLLFGGTNSVTISAYTGAFGSPASLFATDSTKSYLITFLVGTNAGNAMKWTESHAGSWGSYVLPAPSTPSSADAQAADWSSKTKNESLDLLAIYGVYTTYPSNGLFTSQIFDTKINSPSYSNVSWNASCPAYTSIQIKVRTGTRPDLSDAPTWTNATAFSSSSSSGSGSISGLSGRYVQFQAVLNPDLSSSYRGWNSPRLKDVAITWAGATKIVDIGATMTKGPSYGICEVTVDGNPLTKGLRIDLSIFKVIAGWGSTGKTNTSSMTTEISPRNTGK